MIFINFASKWTWVVIHTAFNKQNQVKILGKNEEVLKCIINQEYYLLN